MEAAVAEEEAGMTEWNDGRLDELSAQMRRGFERVDQRFEEVQEDIRELDVRFDGLQKTIIQMGSVVIAALIGLIATQI